MQYQLIFSNLQMSPFLEVFIILTHMDQGDFQDRKKLIEELQGTVDKSQEKQQEQDVDCVDSKVWIWDGDQYEQFQSEYLNQIFPYKLSKKTMTSDSKFIFHFLASSLNYWVELVQQNQPEVGKLGKKDSKFISQMLQSEQCQNHIAYRRWGEHFNKQQQYLNKEDEEAKYQPPKGQIIHRYTRGDDQYEIVKYYGNDKQFYKFKQRMQVLLLFYIDGVSFIFQEVDTWIYYLIFKKVKDSHRRIFVGMLSKYIFRLSTVKQRHRVSQVFILPAYQKSGHGKELIDVVYDISLKDPKCFQITTEIPSFEYQCLRDFKELQLLLKSKTMNLELMVPIKTAKQIQQNRYILMKRQNVRKIKQELKIPGHQIERLVNILIFYKIGKQNDDMVKSHFQQDIRDKIIINRSPFKTRKRLPHLTMYGNVPNLKDFMIEKAKEDILRNQDEVLEIQIETMNGFNRVVAKALKSGLLE